jgi:large conductance mechanosensitive channel
MLKEFREFALKGNMVDLATGGIDFSQMYVQLSGASAATLAQAREAGATIAYGNFITLLINFLIVAWVLFMVVKAMNRLKRQPPASPAEKPRQEVLLEEIRDLLAKR